MNKYLEQADKIIKQVEKINDYFDNKANYHYSIICKEGLIDGHNYTFDLTFNYIGEWDKLKLFKTMVEDCFDIKTYGTCLGFKYYSTQSLEVPKIIDTIEFSGRIPING